jgi:hypothetical protein
MGIRSVVTGIPAGWAAPGSLSNSGYSESNGDLDEAAGAAVHTACACAAIWSYDFATGVMGLRRITQHENSERS